MPRFGLRLSLVGVCLSFTLGALAPAQLAVQTTQPTMNANNAVRSDGVSVTFDRAVDPATVTGVNFHAFGKVSGPIVGTLTLSNVNRTVSLAPADPFMAGEVVMVVLSRFLRAADGTFLRPQGYSFMFTTGVTPTHHRFSPMGNISNRDATGAQTRIYGGLACDLNGDNLVGQILPRS